jgi:hypothetical protein
LSQVRADEPRDAGDDHRTVDGLSHEPGLPALGGSSGVAATFDVLFRLQGGPCDVPSAHGGQSQRRAQVQHRRLCRSRAGPSARGLNHTANGGNQCRAMVGAIWGARARPSMRCTCVSWAFTPQTSA